MQLNVKDETSKLKAVLLGIAQSFGGTPKLKDTYDPKSKEHILKGIFPIETDLIKEMNAFYKVLNKYNVKVYRPQNIENYNQIFSRDIGFVIDDKFFISNILPNRDREIKAIQYLINDIDENHLINLPDEVHIEGGDIIPWKNHVFIGTYYGEDYPNYITARTNKAAVDFITNMFPNKTIKAFELNKSNTKPRNNALHLDCCFQPIGKDKSIIYKGGFRNIKDYNFLIDFFGKENCFEITRDEMYNMNSNIFSISPKVVVSEQSFNRLNTKLKEWEFTVEAIPYAEIAKMGGLLRCSTMPLIRA